MILKKNINILYLKGLLCHRRRRYSIQKRTQRSSLHLVLQIVLVQISLFFKSSWFKIASAARNEAVLSPKKQRRPLPVLLYKSFFFVLCVLTSLPVSTHGAHAHWSPPAYPTRAAVPAPPHPAPPAHSSTESNRNLCPTWQEVTPKTTSGRVTAGKTFRGLLL